jgi:electron transport complex protein RnfG
MKTILHMLATLSLVGLLSGGALALVNAWAGPLIEANETRVKLAAVMEVVPGGVRSQPLAELAPASDLDAYLVFTSSGEPAGWAVVGTGTGFSDKIRLMVGLSPDLEQTLGLKVLKDAETPGLGTEIRAGAFPDRFFGRGGEAPSLALQELKVVKGAPAAPHEIQAITGATISSKAVVRIVNDCVARLRAVAAGRAWAFDGIRAHVEGHSTGILRRAMAFARKISASNGTDRPDASVGWGDEDREVAKPDRLLGPVAAAQRMEGGA